MAKRTVFLLVVLLLVTSYSVPARAVSASAPKAAREPAPQSKVQVWNDPGGDLWVSTPYYTWNITGGSAILPPSGSPAMTVSAGTRLVNSLFLAPGAAEDLTGKILFSLPDEAAVYIQRSGPAGEEGLELHFRAEDGLITLVHRGQVHLEPLEPRDRRVADISYKPAEEALHRRALRGLAHDGDVALVLVAPEHLNRILHHLALHTCPSSGSVAAPGRAELFRSYFES